MSTNTVRYLATALAAATALLTVRATDYYVSMTGDDNAENAGTQQAPFATIDKAVITATSSDDVIYVAPGEYETSLPEYVAQTDDAKWGPNLKAKLVGTGLDRTNVVLKSHGEYRTLRMAAGSMVTNATIVGVTSNVANKGGAIEMSGGTLVDCVVRDGHAYNGADNLNGGNIYMTGNSVVQNCLISEGVANKRGGNVYIDSGVLQDCTIINGASENIGGNIYLYNGTVTNCTITGGVSTNNGGNVFVHNGSAQLIVGCAISHGTAGGDGGNVRLQDSAGRLLDCLITDGVITSAQSQKKGSNVYMDNSAKMVRCHLSGGSHEGYDGGSLCVYSSSARVEDCLVEGSECGGVLMGATTYMYNCTIVNNKKYGVWSWSETQHLFNIIVYGNKNGSNIKEWSGNQPTASGADFLNCAVSTSSLSSSKFPTLVEIDDFAFIDYANGMYSPALGGALVDAGCEDPRQDKSTTDLRGHARVNGNAVDIGCYELKHVCVNENTTGAVEPYDTPGKALATIQGALAVADVTVIQVYPGTYETTSQMTISNPVLIRGVPSGSDEVIVKNTSIANGSNPYCRVFELNNSEAKIENLVLENGQVYNQNGGNLRIAAGVATRCIVRGGTATANDNVNNSLASGAGVEVSGSGVLTHCVITNNAVNGTAKDGSYAFAGGAVFVPYGAAPKISNCLVAFNTYTPSVPSVAGSAGIRCGGSNEKAIFENVTIVSNVVNGIIAPASAGMYCTSWSTTVRNCVFAGNYVTGTDSCSAAYFQDQGHMNVRNCAMDVVDTHYTSNIVQGTPDDFFKDFANGDFRPCTGGKLYNKGATPSISTSVDLLGNPRVFGRTIDIGCYESQVRPGVIMIFY